MTKREQVFAIVGAALGAALLTVIVRVLVPPGPAGDEEGIRVKNGGSVTIEALDTEFAEYDDSGTRRFRSKGPFKKKVAVVVVNGTCVDGVDILTKATSFEFTTTGADGGSATVTHRFDRGKDGFELEAWGGWALAGTHVAFGNAAATLVSVKASTNGNAKTLTCTTQDDTVVMLFPS